MVNINITYENNSLIYVVDYIKNRNVLESQFKYKKIGENFYFKSDLFRLENEWNKMNDINFYDTDILTSSATIRLYFPQHSVETYSNNVKYVLDAYTFINNIKISLGSFLIDRYNALAAPDIIKFQGQEYYECIDFDIVDPYDILYSDKFEAFRKSIKGVTEENNNDPSSLYISLHPVYNDGDIYIIDDRFNGGQNSINISTDLLHDFLNYEIRYNDDNSISGIIQYNGVYDNLKDYIRETYFWEGSINVKYLLALDKISPSIIEHKYSQDNLMEYCSFTYDDIKNSIKCAIPNNNVYILDNFFDNWNYWKEGINFVSTIIFYTVEDGEEVEKIKIVSNKIPITQKLYSKFKVNEQLKIDLSDMNINNINVVNVVGNKTIKYNIPESSKNNIILPVFYRVRELGNIVIHPAVNENICINLDAYKSKVDTFVIQIEGVKFIEIGATGAGTIFKIIGSSLPGVIKSGTYYIMSQDGELVTTGKYIYEY